jgi:hypothetical protein
MLSAKSARRAEVMPDLADLADTGSNGLGLGDTLEMSRPGTLFGVTNNGDLF